MKKTIVAVGLIFLGTANAYAGSLECDMLRQDILSLNQQINMQQQVNQQQQDRETAQLAQMDTWSVLAYNAAKSGQQLGSAVGGAMGGGDRKRLQNMINVYNQNCQ